MATDTILMISPAEFTRQPLFKSANIFEVEDLLLNCSLLRIEAGRVVIAADQPNERMYVVLRGELSVRLESPDSTPVAMLSNGEVFGELSAIDGLPTSAYVVTESQCRLLGIDKDGVWAMFRRSPEIARNLLQILAQRLRANNRLIADLQRELGNEPLPIGEEAAEEITLHND